MATHWWYLSSQRWCLCQYCGKLLSSVLHNYLLSQCTSGSALHEASRCGKEDTVKLLLDKGIIPPSPSPSLPLIMVFTLCWLRY